MPHKERVKKMRLNRFCLVLMVFCAVASPAFAAETPRTLAPPMSTGADWLLMTPQEKVQCVNAAVAFLKAKGIPVQRHPGYYGAALNTVVDQPGAEKANITNLVTTLVYKAEPQTRVVIDQLRIKSTKKSAVK